VVTNVSEERLASNFRVKRVRIGKAENGLWERKEGEEGQVNTEVMKSATPA
jgi:hypothetical protein